MEWLSTFGACLALPPPGVLAQATHCLASGFEEHCLPALQELWQFGVSDSGSGAHKLQTHFSVTGTKVCHVLMAVFRNAGPRLCFSTKDGRRFQAKLLLKSKQKLPKANITQKISPKKYYPKNITQKKLTKN